MARLAQYFDQLDQISENGKVRYRGIRDAKDRESVTIDFKPIKASKADELEARFDIVLGVTPRKS